MRIFILSFFMLFASIATAQPLTFSDVGTTATTGTVNIAGKYFAGGVSRTGSVYIIRVSGTTGKEYKSYLGTPIGQDYKGAKVFTANVKGQPVYFYFTISDKTGFPSKHTLKTS